MRVQVVANQDHFFGVRIPGPEKLLLGDGPADFRAVRASADLSPTGQQFFELFDRATQRQPFLVRKADDLLPLQGNPPWLPTLSQISPATSTLNIQS